MTNQPEHIKNKQEAIKQLDDIWYTKSGYQNEDLPLAHDDIKKLMSKVWQAAYREGARDASDDIRGYEHESGQRFFYTSDGEREDMLENKYSISDKEPKGFFDLPENEKREIVEQAAQDSNEAQRELVEKNRT